MTCHFLYQDPNHLEFYCNFLCSKATWCHLSTIIEIIDSLLCSIAGLWPHAYFRHVLNPEGESQAQPASMDRRNSLLNGSFRGADGLEMRTTSQALDSMEAGRREQWPSTNMKSFSICHVNSIPQSMKHMSVPVYSVMYDAYGMINTAAIAFWTIFCARMQMCHVAQRNMSLTWAEWIVQQDSMNFLSVYQPNWMLDPRDSSLPFYAICLAAIWSRWRTFLCEVNWKVVFPPVTKECHFGPTHFLKPNFDH